MNNKKAFEPIKIGSITLKNRYAVSPMGTVWEQMSSLGAYTDNFIEYLTERARGGFGLITLGSAQAETDVNGAHPYDDVHSPLRAPKTFRCAAIKMTDRVHKHGCKIFFQDSVGHGRMRFQKTPSPIPQLYAPDVLGQEMTKEEIEHKIDCAIKLAVLAKSSGFDGVEIHGMHWGYLLDQFACENMNHRTDEYGGDLDGRLNFVRKIIVGIKEACGKDYPVSIRFTIKHYMRGYNKASLTGEGEFGRDLSDAIEIAKKLESYGVDMLNCNSGSYDGFYYAMPPYYMDYGYNIKLAKELKKAVSIPVFLAGKMDDPEMAEKALEDGEIDGIVLGRASLADSHYPQKLMMGRPEQIRPCICCHNCTATLFDGGLPMCSVNPALFNVNTYGITPALEKKNVVVIGGGVAGMEAARTAALRGHSVSLYEKSDRLGGHLIEAGSHCFKSGIARLSAWYENELKRLKVNVCLNTCLDAAQIKELAPDALISAVGSTHFVPPIPGSDSDKACLCLDVLLKKRQLGQNVVVVGGGLTGSELAYDLTAYEGKTVTLVEALDDILSAGMSVPTAVDTMLRDLLDYNNVNIITGKRIVAVTELGAVLKASDGSEETVPADDVIFAIGLKPAKGLLDELTGAGIELHQVGDCTGIGNIRTAIAGAYEIAKGI